MEKVVYRVVSPLKTAKVLAQPVRTSYIYMLIREEGEIAYIGTTFHPEKRCKTHSKKKSFDLMVVIEAYHSRREALTREHYLQKEIGFSEGGLYTSEENLT